MTQRYSCFAYLFVFFESFEELRLQCSKQLYIFIRDNGWYQLLMVEILSIPQHQYVVDETRTR